VRILVTPIWTSLVVMAMNHTLHLLVILVRAVDDKYSIQVVPASSVLENIYS
jgi:hypothetical protein